MFERAALTNQDGHKYATDPLLNHLLDLWFWALGHDSESVGVGDGSHGGSAEPGNAENGRDASHGDEEEQIKMETGSFHHLPLRFAHNQAGDPWRQEEVNSASCEVISNDDVIHCVTHVVIWDSRKMRMKTSSAGTQQAAIIQTGKGFFSPMGLINQPLSLGLVTSTPLGTTSFYKTTGGVHSEKHKLLVLSWITEPNLLRTIK